MSQPPSAHDVVSNFLAAQSGLDRETIPLTLQEMIPREPTTLYERRKLFRARVQQMMMNKSHQRYVQDIAMTTDQGLRMVRDAAVGRSSIGHATLIEHLRQQRIARSRSHTSNEN
jgi:hypothetical protein